MKYIWFAILLILSQNVSSDPIAPSLLEVDYQGDARFTVMWRTPIKPLKSNSMSLSLSFAESCMLQRRGDVQYMNALVEENLLVECASADNFWVTIESLNSPSANVLLRFFDNGKQIHSRILNPADARFTYQQDHQAKQVLDYFYFGIRHLMIGFDHVLYLFCLIILAGITRSLIITISLFTVAHSLTLAAAILELVRLPVQWVEAAIAFSIVYSAIMVVQKTNNQTPRKLWLSAFIFGLLHGLGFSNVLLDLGLPTNEIVTALLLFNLGIEAGQLLVFGLVSILVLGVIQNIGHFKQHSAMYRSVLGWMIGLIASYWFWQRILGG